MLDKKKSQIYDDLKLAAMLLVVLAHSTVMYTVNGAFHPVNSSHMLEILTTAIYSFHMPLFILVSGAVYAYCLQMGKYQEHLPFLKNKLLRLLFPYFFWGFFYVAPVMELLGLDQSGYFAYCWNGIVLSHNSRHLWYLFALFWIYVFVRLTRRVYYWGRSNMLCLSAAVFLMYPYVHVGFQISAAMRYQLYFVLGMLFHDYAGKQNRKLLLGGVVFAAFCIASGICVPTSHGWDVVLALLGCCGMLIFVLLCRKWFPHMHETSWYQLLKRDIMGIYLIHPMLLYGMYSQLGQKDIHPVVLSLGAALAALLLSMLGTECIRRLGFSVLLGEKQKRQKPTS